MEDVESEVESTETCHGLLRSDMKVNEPKSVETHEDMVRLCKFCKNALDKQDPEAVIAFQAVGEQNGNPIPVYHKAVVGFSLAPYYTVHRILLCLLGDA